MRLPRAPRPAARAARGPTICMAATPPAGAPGAPRRALRPATLLLQDDSGADPHGASMPPIYQTATFSQPGATTMGEYDYSRSGNPTRTVLERQVAALEGGDRALAFASGMAALAAVLRLAASGEHVVAGDDLYGGTSRLLSRVAPVAGVDVSFVDTCNVGAVTAALRPGVTKLVMLESPTNPRMQVCDVAAICAAARAVCPDVIVCVDNSIMAPLFQRPLDLGADIVMTSATKFIGGHSDVTGGLLSVRGTALAERLAFHANAEGTALGPFDCWLLVRGLKTMAVRMERQAANAARLAAFLEAHPAVVQVNYPGLASHPGHALHFRQATSAGSVLSFTTGDAALSQAVVEALALFKITVSFGNVRSQVSMPCFMSHASIPAEVRAARGLPDDLVRISAGIEDGEDLLEDLEAALAAAGRPAA
jgi:cystathionine beta-lyase